MQLLNNLLRVEITTHHVGETKKKDTLCEEKVHDGPYFLLTFLPQRS